MFKKILYLSLCSCLLLTGCSKKEVQETNLSETSTIEDGQETMSEVETNTDINIENNEESYYDLILNSLNKSVSEISEEYVTWEDCTHSNIEDSWIKPWGIMTGISEKSTSFIEDKFNVYNFSNDWISTKDAKICSVKIDDVRSFFNLSDDVTAQEVLEKLNEMYGESKCFTIEENWNTVNINIFTVTNDILFVIGTEDDYLVSSYSHFICKNYLSALINTSEIIESFPEAKMPESNKIAFDGWSSEKRFPYKENASISLRIADKIYHIKNLDNFTEGSDMNYYYENDNYLTVPVINYSSKNSGTERISFGIYPNGSAGFHGIYGFKKTSSNENPDRWNVIEEGENYTIYYANEEFYAGSNQYMMFVNIHDIDTNICIEESYRDYSSTPTEKEELIEIAKNIVKFFNENVTVESL